MTAHRSVIIAVWALVTLLCVEAIGGPNCGPDLSKLLLRATLPSDAELPLSRKEILFLYKNDPNFAAWMIAKGLESEDPDVLIERYRGDQEARPPALPPKTIDLSPARRRVLLARDDTATEASSWLFGRRIEISEYERKVMELRAGDSVVFGETRVTLGKFLGRGNATHVFALETLDGKKVEGLVIRIPFMSREMWPARRAFDFMKRFVELENEIPDGVDRVRIVRSDDEHSFAIVDEVKGDTNGAQFLDSLSDSPEPAAKAQHDKLIAAVQSRFPDRPIFSREPNGEDMHRQARQFVWEPSAERWVLVDWE